MVRMMYTATVTSKGQITIPAEVRKQLGLRDGDRLEFHVERNVTTIRPAARGESPFRKYMGALDDERSLEEILRQERIDRGRDDS